MTPVFLCTVLSFPDFHVFASIRDIRSVKMYIIIQTQSFSLSVSISGLLPLHSRVQPVNSASRSGGASPEGPAFHLAGSTVPQPTSILELTFTCLKLFFCTFLPFKKSDEKTKTSSVLVHLLMLSDFHIEPVTPISRSPTEDVNLHKHLTDQA